MTKTWPSRPRNSRKPFRIFLIKYTRSRRICKIRFWTKKPSQSRVLFCTWMRFKVKSRRRLKPRKKLIVFNRLWFSKSQTLKGFMNLNNSFWSFSDCGTVAKSTMIILRRLKRFISWELTSRAWSPSAQKWRSYRLNVERIWRPAMFANYLERRWPPF